MVTNNVYTKFRELYNTDAYKATFDVDDGSFSIMLYKCLNITWQGKTKWKIKYGKPVCVIPIILSRLGFVESLYQSCFHGDGTFGRENKINYAEYKAYVMHGFMENATNTPLDLAQCAIGWLAESAEAIDHIKKHIWHNQKVDKRLILLEAGDAIWYMTAMLCLLDISLADILTANKAKLDERYKQGRKDLVFRDTKLEYTKVKEALSRTDDSMAES